MKFSAALVLFSAVALSNALVIRQANSTQTFTGALGGIAATPIEDSGDAKRPFSVAGATFVNLGAAVQRSCDQQFNKCANLANGGSQDVAFADCTSQKGTYLLHFRSEMVLINVRPMRCGRCSAVKKRSADGYDWKLTDMLGILNMTGLS